MTLLEISPERRAVLDLVAIRGATHASSSLSRWFGREVKIHSDGFQSVPIEKVADLGLPIDENVVAIHNRIVGEVEGNVLLAFEEGTAFDICELLLHLEPGQLETLDELECSALQETGNITASAFVGSLGTTLGLKLLPGVPTLLHDVGGAILEPMLLEQLLASNTALMIEARFEIDDRSIDWWLHVMPSPESLAIMEAHLR